MIKLRPRLLWKLLNVPRLHFGVEQYIDQSKLSSLIAPKRAPSTREEFSSLLLSEMKDFIKNVSEAEAK